MTEGKPGRPPKVPMEKRPEFQAAVAEAAALVVQALTRGGTLPAVGDGGPIDAPTKQLFSEMAMSMAEIADQGMNRKRVDPKILAKREAAGQRMFETLAEVHDKVKVARETEDEVSQAAWTPEYRVIAKLCLNERVIEPFFINGAKEPTPREIYWLGPPSDGMMPLNAIAKKIFADYKEWLGTDVVLGKTNFAPDTRPMWVTAGGLVVKGDPPARRHVAAAPDFKDELGVKNGTDPRQPFVNVVGTIAEPARQNTVAGAHG